MEYGEKYYDRDKINFYIKVLNNILEISHISKLYL